VQNKSLIPNLLEVKLLGTQTIKCYQPTSHWEVKGVISGIGPDVSEEEIIAAVNEQNPSKISRAIRLNAGKEKTPSLSIKLIFVEGVKELPGNIKIGYQRFSVRLFKEKLLQCFKCQGFGHSSKRCGALEKGVYCAGNHRLSECPKEQIKCANCDGDHTSSYSKCPRLVEAKDVNDIRVEHKLTYREAALAYKESVTVRVPVLPTTQGIARPPARPQAYKDTNNNNERRLAPGILVQTQDPVGMEIKDNSINKEKLCAYIIELLQALIGIPKDQTSQNTNTR
jgi:hypothetical protein